MQYVKSILILETKERRWCNMEQALSGEPHACGNNLNHNRLGRFYRRIGDFA